ncbi:MAG: hypothetical protein OEZ10_01180 [Gammaproteobacteria bacterium]|nr:hypothetical protein [Gammaproteobacteria bacterium]
MKFKSLLTVLITACFIVPLGSSAEPPAAGNSAATVVQLKEKPDCQFTVTPERATVKQGGKIVFAGIKDFSIEFKKGSPFSKNSFSTSSDKLTISVPATAKTGTYKYDLVTKRGGKECRLDPDIIIVRA